MGNAASGSYTLSGGSTTTYTMREVESGGLYTLTETGVDGMTQAESGNVVTAAYQRVVGGTDSFTLAETSSSSAQTMTAIELYTDTVSGNTAQDTSTTTTTGSGTYTYAGSGSSWWTYGYTLLEAGNARAGSFSQSMTGTDRYSLMMSFDNVANTLAGQAPGNVTFHSHGLPFRDPSLGSNGTSGNPFGAMAWVSDVTHQGGGVHAAALIGGPPAGLGVGANPANGSLGQWTGWTTGVTANTVGLKARYVSPPPPPVDPMAKEMANATGAPCLLKISANHVISPGDAEALNATRPGGSVHEQAPAVAAAVHTVGTIVMQVPMMVAGMAGPVAGLMGFQGVANALAPWATAAVPAMAAQSAFHFAMAVANKDPVAAAHAALSFVGCFYGPAMIASCVWDVGEGVYTLSTSEDRGARLEAWEQIGMGGFGLAVAGQHGAFSRGGRGGGKLGGAKKGPVIIGEVSVQSVKPSKLEYTPGDFGPGRNGMPAELGGGTKPTGIVGEVSGTSGKPLEVQYKPGYWGGPSPDGMPVELGGGVKPSGVVGEASGEWGAASVSGSGRRGTAILEGQASQRKASLEIARSMAEGNPTAEHMVSPEGGGPPKGKSAEAEAEIYNRTVPLGPRVRFEPGRFHVGSPHQGRQPPPPHNAPRLVPAVYPPNPVRTHIRFDEYARSASSTHRCCSFRSRVRRAPLDNGGHCVVGWRPWRRLLRQRGELPCERE